MEFFERQQGNIEGFGIGFSSAFSLHAKKNLPGRGKPAFEKEGFLGFSGFAKDKFNENKFNENKFKKKRGLRPPHPPFWSA